MKRLVDEMTINETLHRYLPTQLIYISSLDVSDLYISSILFIGAKIVFTRTTQVARILNDSSGNVIVGLKEADEHEERAEVYTHVKAHLITFFVLNGFLIRNIQSNRVIYGKWGIIIW